MAETVSDLLKRSMQEHTRAATLRRSGDRDSAKEALIHARDLRIEAINLDPEKTDPVWEGERVRHDEMMAWYAIKLDPPVI